MNNQNVIGIDLGTTFSVVAHLNTNGQPETIPNDEGDISTPSVVFFDKDRVVVGVEAVNAGEFESDRVASFAKRDIGNKRFHKRIHGKTFPPEVVQALILKKLKTDAELKIGPCNEAVVTVPAYFNEPRRKATQDAGELAGLKVIDIINEPTAAALAFGVKRGFVNTQGTALSDERVLVYDLGGGTFDATLMEIKGNKFQAVCTAGDVHLGGIDWDMRIANFLAERFENEFGMDPRNDDFALQKICELASRAKKTLSARDKTDVRFAMDGNHSRMEISRAQFDSLTEDLVARTKMTVNRLLKDAGLGWRDLTRLLLVGGSTRMPMIQEMLERESGMTCDRSLSPDEAVAHGAAVYANIVKQQGPHQLLVTNVNSHDLGVLGLDPQTKKPQRRLMIRRNTIIPAVATKKFITSNDSQKEVVVTVVEGGTDTGFGASKIGKCRVSGLPAGMRKGTPVTVTFKYSSDGRLSVDAEIPSINSSATTVIERTPGLSDQEKEDWMTKIAGGITVKDENSNAHDKKAVESPETKSTNPNLPSTNKPKNKSKPKCKVDFEAFAGMPRSPEPHLSASEFVDLGGAGNPNNASSLSGLSFLGKPNRVEDFVIGEKEIAELDEHDSLLDDFLKNMD